MHHVQLSTKKIKRHAKRKKQTNKKAQSEETKYASEMVSDMIQILESSDREF